MWSGVSSLHGIKVFVLVIKTWQEGEGDTYVNEAGTRDRRILKSAF